MRKSLVNASALKLTPMKFTMGWLQFLQVITIQCQGSEAGIHCASDTLQKGKQSIAAVDVCLADRIKNSHKPLFILLVKLSKDYSAFAGPNLASKTTYF